MPPRLLPPLSSLPRDLPSAGRWYQRASTSLVGRPRRAPPPPPVSSAPPLATRSAATREAKGGVAAARWLPLPPPLPPLPLLPLLPLPHTSMTPDAAAPSPPACGTCTASSAAPPPRGCSQQHSAGFGPVRSTRHSTRDGTSSSITRPRLSAAATSSPAGWRRSRWTRRAGSRIARTVESTSPRVSGAVGGGGVSSWAGALHHRDANDKVLDTALPTSSAASPRAEGGGSSGASHTTRLGESPASSSRSWSESPPSSSASSGDETPRGRTHASKRVPTPFGRLHTRWATAACASPPVAVASDWLACSALSSDSPSRMTTALACTTSRSPSECRMLWMAPAGSRTEVLDVCESSGVAS